MADQYVEWHPATCPKGHDWSKPRSFRPGWQASATEAGHRIWECATCGEIIHATPGESLL